MYQAGSQVQRLTHLYRALAFSCRTVKWYMPKMQGINLSFFFNSSKQEDSGGLALEGAVGSVDSITGCALKIVKRYMKHGFTIFYEENFAALCEAKLPRLTR